MKNELNIDGANRYCDFPFVEAIYRKSEIPEQRGNILIEALPAIPDDATLRRQLHVLPPFNEQERRLPDHIRGQLVRRVRDIFIATPRVVELARSMMSMVHAGYERRRPNTQESISSLRALYQAQMTGDFVSVKQTAEIAKFSMTLTGPSGQGKSTAIGHIRGLLPPVIYHPQPGIWQLPFLVVEMSTDGRDVHQLATEIASEMDKLLPDAGYAELMKRTTTTNANYRLGAVLRTAREHGLGMLIVDEGQSQAVSSGRDGGTQATAKETTVAKALTTASNTSGVPTMIAGTPELKTKREARFTTGRRGSGSGSAAWGNLTRTRTNNGGDFETLLKVLFKYQWVRNPISYSDEFADLYFDLTQGVPDIMVKLWEAVQIEAISYKQEAISPELLRVVLGKYFAMSENGLLYLKHRNKLPKDVRFVTDLAESDQTMEQRVYDETGMPMVLAPLGVYPYHYGHQLQSSSHVAGTGAAAENSQTKDAVAPVAKATKAKKPAKQKVIPSPLPAVLDASVVASADIRGTTDSKALGLVTAAEFAL